MPHSCNPEDIRSRVETVSREIRDAARRAGRDPESVTLVAVSKTFGPEAVRAAFAAGVRHFGENRVQEARRKIPWCPEGITWHGIGYLQTNKVRHAVELFQWIHSVDRPRLVRALEERCAAAGKRLNVLVEVKLSPEPTKAGCAEEGVEPLVERILKAEHLRFCGLMTLPPYHPDPERSRPYFRRLTEILERLRESFALSGRELELSMGMSHDFAVAVEEGATLIRVGRAIFGPREDE